jgi:hypothetical protein
VRRALAAVLVALAVALAACGGSSSDDATGGRATATAPAPPPAGDLAGRLPPEDAVPGLRPGTPGRLRTAAAFVGALYQAGDPMRAAAGRRLEGGGYAEGVLRDQAGEDPETGVALVRSYAVRMRDDGAARAEAEAAAAEVEDSPLGDATELEVPGIEGARALRVEVTRGDFSGTVIFVTFAEGPYVHGLQAVARSGADLPEDEVIQAAQELAARVGASP